MPPDTLELFCIRVIKKPYKNWDRVIPYFRFKCIRKCVFAYMEATPLLACRPELAGTSANSEDTDETPHDLGISSGSALFAKTNQSSENEIQYYMVLKNK